jgi:hypothetical protein
MANNVNGALTDYGEELVEKSFFNSNYTRVSTATISMFNASSDTVDENTQDKSSLSTAQTSIEQVVNLVDGDGSVDGSGDASSVDVNASGDTIRATFNVRFDVSGITSSTVVDHFYMTATFTSDVAGAQGSATENLIAVGTLGGSRDLSENDTVDVTVHLELQ